MVYVYVVLVMGGCKHVRRVYYCGWAGAQKKRQRENVSVCACVWGCAQCLGWSACKLGVCEPARAIQCVLRAAVVNRHYARTREIFSLRENKGTPFRRFRCRTPGRAGAHSGTGEACPFLGLRAGIPE